MRIKKSIQREFLRDLEGRLAALGAFRANHDAAILDDREETHGAEWWLSTAAGRLVIHPEACVRMFSILCKFEDGKAADTIAGASVPSGKWNWHEMPKDEPGRSPEELAGRVVSDFVDRITKPGGIAAFAFDRGGDPIPESPEYLAKVEQAQTDNARGLLLGANNTLPGAGEVLRHGDRDRAAKFAHAAAAMLRHAERAAVRRALVLSQQRNAA